jgi:hypothetical protein
MYQPFALSDKKANAESSLWIEKKSILWLSAVIIASLCMRVFFYSVTSYGIATDSGAYIDLAEQIKQSSLAEDNGLRTPGYPLFILTLGMNPEVIRAAQMGLGILITIMLFLIVYQITHNLFFSTIAGAMYGLNVSMISFENSILTETLTTFLVTLCILLFIYIQPKIDSHKLLVPWLLLVGGISAFTGLVRPNFLFLSLLFAGIILVKLVRERFKYPYLLTLVFLLPTFILIGGWSSYNYLRLGSFGPSTITGFSLTNHSVKFVQYAPEQYSVIRESFLAAREQLGTSDLRWWSGNAVEEIMSKTGWSYPQLSSELTKMSIYLFIHHPALYAKGVLSGWVNFWNTTGPLTALSGKDVFTFPWKNSLLLFSKIWEDIERYATVFFVQLPFLICVILVPFQLLLKPRRQYFLLNLPIAVMSAVIILTSITSSMVENDTPARYAIPVRALIVCVVASEIWWIWRQNKQTGVQGQISG